MRNYFITGGTGFIGRAVVRELLKDSATTQITCLTRKLRPDAIQDSKVSYLIGDITSVEFPDAEQFTDVIHAAAEANDLLCPDKMRYYYDVVEGARRIFEWSSSKFYRKVLFVSSGGVVKGDSVYCRSKRMSERIMPQWCKLARIYSVVGPEMPLNGQYALGRFIWDAVTNGQVRFYESGSVRSYLHVDDCARWLLAVLDKGMTSTPYNVGSDLPIAIRDLAQLVAEIAEVPCVEVKREDFHTSAQVYVPNIELSKGLGCNKTVALATAIAEVISIHRGG